MKEPEGYLPKGVVQQGPHLVITDALPEISGDYVCIVYTPEGQVKKTIRINVNPQEPMYPPTIYSPNQKSTRVKVGTPFMLQCVAHGNPIPSIRIETPKRSAGPYPPARLVDRLQVKFNLTLKIKYFNTFNKTKANPTAKFEVSYFTPDNAGEYRCIAENELGEQAYELFYVVAEPAIRRDPPTIRIEPKEIDAYEGSNVIINTTYSVYFLLLILLS